METQQIANSDNKSSKLATKKWYAHNQNGTDYGEDTSIKFKTKRYQIKSLRLFRYIFS